jgi:hypothetical protein
MISYWSTNPPVHLMVAAYLGIESKPKETTYASEEDVASILAAFGQGR